MSKNEGTLSNTKKRKSNNFPEKRWLKEDFRWFTLIFHALRITSGNNIPGTISIDRREDEGSGMVEGEKHVDSSFCDAQLCEMFEM